MKRTLILLFTSLSLVANAQSAIGKVTYTRATYWTHIMEKLPYLSQEEKDRAKLTWGKEDGYKSTFILTFNGNESLYNHDENEKNEWGGRNSDFQLYRNFETHRRKDLIETLSNTYLVEDSLIFPKWKILNEFKEIAGYVCMKAETRDTVKNQVISAWFTDAIVSQAGPEETCGLPGLILGLEINKNHVIIEASKVELMTKLDTPVMPKKMKGKKVNVAAYNKIIKTYIDDCIKGRRNPYWNLRY